MGVVCDCVCVCVCVCIGGKRLNDYSVMRFVKDFTNHLFALTCVFVSIDNEILII